MAVLRDSVVVPRIRRFQTGALASRYGTTPTPNIVKPTVPRVEEKKRRFRSGSLGNQYETSASDIAGPEVSPIEPENRNYNIESVQSIGAQPTFIRRSLILKSLGFGASFKALNTIRLQNEALMAQRGLQAVYNAPFAGEAGVSGWGTTFGEAWNRAGAVEDITVSYLTETERANASMRAMLVDAQRGSQPVAGSYRYTLSDPSRFAPVGRAASNILKGLSKASSSLTAFTLIPGLNKENFLNNLLPPQYRGITPEADV